MRRIPRRSKRTTDAVTIIHRRYYAGRPKRQADLREARLQDSVARMLQAFRIKAGLSQQELARRIGTTASAISRLESADYDGHSLSMLRHIAEALGRRVEIKLVPEPKRSKSAVPA